MNLYEDTHVMIQSNELGNRRGVYLMGRTGGMCPSLFEHHASQRAALASYTAILVRQVEHLEKWADLKIQEVRRLEAEKAGVISRMGLRGYLAVSRGEDLAVLEKGA